MIRENNINSLEVFASEKQGDEVTYQGKKEWVDFRKDGQPIQQITWDVYHRDSIITDYSYDSLGNLIEYFHWIPKRSRYEELKVLEQVFFQYEAGKLIKVLSYSMKNGDNYSTLNYCDSLSYSLDKQKVRILHGNANGTNVVYQKNPRFIYPFNTKIQIDLVATEQEQLDKPIDNEDSWSTPCNFINPDLKKIQSRIKNKCLNRGIITSYGFERISTPKVTFERSVFDSLTEVFFVDTLNQWLFIKSNSFFSQPTSLEDRITHTRSIDRYNFQMQLLISESIRETSRGQREYSHDNSQTFYTYFEFGLLRRKLEYHYPNYLPRGFVQVHSDQKNESDQPVFETEPILILEEKTVIKKWD